MGIKNFCLLFFFFFLFPLFFPDFTLATSNVKLNEILANPSKGKEWVEIYNPDSLNLVDWVLQEKTASGNINSYKLASSSAIFIIYEFSNKLNDDQDEVTLRDKDGNLIDSYSYQDSETDLSLARIPDGGTWYTSQSLTKGLTNGNLPTAMPTPTPTSTSTPTPTTTPTPTATPTPTPTPTIDYNNILITEIYPTPDSSQGEKEWIEFYNGNDFAVDLEGWIIKDATTTNKRTLIDFEIASKSYAYLNLGSSMLNKDGDTVYLLNSSGIEKDKVIYDQEVETGFSWARNYSVWCLATPTQGKENNNCFFENEDEQNNEKKIVDQTTKSPSAENHNSQTELEQDRNLPDLKQKTEVKEGTVAGISTQKSEEKNYRKFALLVSFGGLLIIAGSMFTMFKRQVLIFFKQIFTKK